MKKFIFIALFFCAYISYSQDFEPTQAKFNWGIGGNQVYLSADTAYFMQDKFLRGWHWGASYKISHAVGANQNDAANSDVEASSLDSNCLIILKPKDYTHGNEDKILNARAIQYEPTLLLNPNNPSNLVIRQGDTTRPVFGFLNRRGRILTDSTDPNFNRLIIDSAELVNQVILSDPWPSNQLSLATIGSSPIDSILNIFLCRTLYFSINLKRTDNEISDEPVLKIELPIIVTDWQDVEFIKFDSIPNDTINKFYELNNGRGKIRKLKRGPSNTKEFYITKNMIPSDGSNITISAFFRCDNDTNNLERSNPLLKDESPKENRIDSIKIKITYLGGGPLMIDWVRLESPHAKNFLSGDFDSLLTAKVQVDLNKIVATPFSDKGIKLFRYNPVIEGRLHSWIAEKYYNKLIGNISTNEANKIIYPAHYEYYVNSPNRWLGTWQIQNHISAPYSQQVYSSSEESKVKTMGLFNGYCGIDTGVIQTDPSKVHYETYLVDYGTGVPIDTFLKQPNDWAKYEKVMNTQNNWNRASFQTYVEDHLYTHFLKETAKGFLFSDKFWWNQGFIHLSWSTESYNNTDYTRYSHRPLTGEEFRLFASLGVLLGAKGLFYDGAESIISNYDKQQFYDYEFLTSNQRTTLNNMTDEEFLDSDLAGPDFIRTSNEIMNLNDRLYDLDTIAKYLDRPANKLYIGRRSLRKEMKRLHDQIRRCEDELMKLRLVAWMGKGYRLWNNHHPDYPDDSTFRRFLAWDEVNNMVDTNRFKIGKLELGK